MFAYLYGILDTVEDNNCIIDVNGIGFNVGISGNTALRLPPIGETVKLYTYTNVKEDAFNLYGFLSKEDLKMFKLLISVNGIGPKNALSILNIFDTASLATAIITSDVKAISKANGVGARSAERVIIDLKGKVSEFTLSESVVSLSAGGTDSTGLSDEKKDALLALASLGYSQSDSLKAINAVTDCEGKDSGYILKKALKNLF